MEFLSQASFKDDICQNETSDWSDVNTSSIWIDMTDDKPYKQEVSAIYGVQNTSFLAPLHSTLNYPLHSTIIDPHQSMQTNELPKERPPCIGQEAEDLNDSDRTSFVDDTLRRYTITYKQRRKNLKMITCQQKQLHQRFRNFYTELRRKKVEVLAVL